MIKKFTIIRRPYSILHLLFFMWIVVFSACNKKQKCGPGKYKNGKIEYYLCDSMLDCDTINPGDERWSGENDMYGIDWIGEFDTIQFRLPEGYTITEAQQAFVIMPSVWAKENDGVVQYISLNDLSAYCPNPKKIEHKNNLFITPVSIDEDLARELYFNTKGDIRKNDLLGEINKIYDRLDEANKNTAPDEFTTSAEINEMIKENQRERATYISYLNNYTSWHNAPRSQFELLAPRRYLTLSVKTATELKKITFTYAPVYGN